MSAQLIHFPPRSAPPLRPAALPSHAPRRYRLHDVARALGLELLSRTTQIARLRLYADKAGFPAPLNDRVRAGRVLRGAAAICAASLWDAAAVEAWRHRPDPSAPAAAAGIPALPPGTRDQMRHRAHQLAAGAGA